MNVSKLRQRELDAFIFDIPDLSVNHALRSAANANILMSVHFVFAEMLVCPKHSKAVVNNPSPAKIAIDSPKTT